MKRINLLGKIFGDLTVICPAPNIIYKTSKAVQWLCKCSCGNEILISASCLLNKKRPRISCGCKNFTKTHGNQKFEDPKIVSYKALIKRYRMSAKDKTKNISWSLTEDQAIQLFNGNCFYCGSSPISTYNVYKTKAGRFTTQHVDRAKKAEIQYNGIDRIDSSLGYEISNVVSCCTICNFAKNELSLEDFYKWIEKLALNQGFKK